MVNAGDTLGGEVDVPHAVGVGGVQGHGVAIEGVADPVAVPVELHPASVAYLSDRGACGIDEGEQGSGKGDEAGVVAAGRHRIGKGFVGTDSVVVVAPVVEGALAVGKIGVHPSGKQSLFEGAVKAFLLALRLRVVGPPRAARARRGA